LRYLARPYTAEVAKAAVERALNRGFKCVNADLMFALPGQTCREVKQAARTLTQLGVHQIAAYPLFRFPYTRLGSNGVVSNYGLGTILKRRKMLRVLEGEFYSADMTVVRVGVHEVRSPQVLFGHGASIRWARREWRVLPHGRVLPQHLQRG